MNSRDFLTAYIQSTIPKEEQETPQMLEEEISDLANSVDSTTIPIADRTPEETSLTEKNSEQNVAPKQESEEQQKEPAVIQGVEMKPAVIQGVEKKPEAIQEVEKKPEITGIPEQIIHKHNLKKTSPVEIKKFVRERVKKVLTNLQKFDKYSYLARKNINEKIDAAESILGAVMDVVNFSIDILDGEEKEPENKQSEGRIVQTDKQGRKYITVIPINT